jgi:hypothetical protein
VFTSILLIDFALMGKREPETTSFGFA